MRYVLLFAGLLSFLSCTNSKMLPSKEQLNKIRFDLSMLDEDGLLGPENGKVALDYEFCIPRDDQYLKAVTRIDPTIKVQLSRGRIGCSPGQYLCLGNTHQKNYREVLYQLAKLTYVERIERAFFE